MQTLRNTTVYIIMYIQRWCRSSVVQCSAARWWAAASGHYDRLRAPRVSWLGNLKSYSSPFRYPPIHHHSWHRAAASGLHTEKHMTHTVTVVFLLTHISSQLIRATENFESPIRRFLEWNQFLCTHEHVITCLDLHLWRLPHKESPQPFKPSCHVHEIILYRPKIKPHSVSGRISLPFLHPSSSPLSISR